MPLISFCTLWQQHKTGGFLLLSGGIERDQWREMCWGFTCSTVQKQCLKWGFLEYCHISISEVNNIIDIKKCFCFETEFYLTKMGFPSRKKTWLYDMLCQYLNFKTMWNCSYWRFLRGSNKMTSVTEMKAKRYVSNFCLFTIAQYCEIQF